MELDPFDVTIMLGELCGLMIYSVFEIVLKTIIFFVVVIVIGRWLSFTLFIQPIAYLL